MLVPAFNYSDELKKKMRDTWFDDKYKYYVFDSYYKELQVDDETLYRHQFVSVDKDDNVIGYIGYNINRQTYNVSGLAIINFTDNKAVFGMDVGKALIEIFEKFRFNKLLFSVVVGNPIEKTYDKMIHKHGGRIVWVYKDEARLVDGKYYDEKIYEIMRDDYLKSKNKEESE